MESNTKEVKHLMDFRSALRKKIVKVKTVQSMINGKMREAKRQQMVYDINKVEDAVEEILDEYLYYAYICGEQKGKNTSIIDLYRIYGIKKSKFIRGK